MLSIDEALAVVRERTAACSGRPAESAPLSEAAGRILAEDVRADVDLPPFSRSTMDGYALRAEDAPAAGVELMISGEAAAGRPGREQVWRGSAMRIFTGAPLPDGADSVVKLEDAALHGDRIRLAGAVHPGENVALQGEDLARGAVALPRGTALSTAHAGLLAALGRGSVPVFPRPRVAILATGSELVEADARPGPGMIRESNGAALAVLVAQAGGTPVMLGVAADDPEVIRARAEAGLGNDLFLLTGGSSVGDYDFTPRVLANLGVQVHFARVRLKPGMPTIFGTRGDCAAFGLPGNPISCFVVFHLLVRPALLLRAGVERTAPLFFPARLGAAVRRLAERDQCLPALLALEDGEWTVRFAGWHGSGDLTCLNRANALMLVPRGPGEVEAGERVRVTPIDGGRGGDVSLGVP
ncbi:MAG: molybdopterin molybdotransferase MoeA [Planctomycetes bacterium]|nr:molybdopterin molybdotransferase MoeA [Planctomycetota bacterium]